MVWPPRLKRGAAGGAGPPALIIYMNMQKEKPLSGSGHKKAQRMNRIFTPCALPPDASGGLYWALAPSLSKVMPPTLTLTAWTVRPLMDSMLVCTASCTARATSGMV